MRMRADGPVRIGPSAVRAAGGHPADQVLPSCRRRGNALLEAIYDGVLAELAEVGFQALTIEGVAKRARTGKAAIYRRWADKTDLVAATLDALMPQVDVLPDTGDIRGDLLLILRTMVEFLNSPSGVALQRIFSDTARCEPGASPSSDVPDLHTIKAQVVSRRQDTLFDLLRRGVERGQVRPSAVCQRVVDTAPSLLLGRCLVSGGRIDDAEIVGIVDEVLVPLIRARIPADTDARA